MCLFNLLRMFGRNYLKGGEEDPQEEMVGLISPPTPEESGGTQGDIREDSHGRRTAYLELLEQIGGSERILLGRILRCAIHEALEDAAEAMESLWNDHPPQFDRVGLVYGKLEGYLLPWKLQIPAKMRAWKQDW